MKPEGLIGSALHVYLPSKNELKFLGNTFLLHKWSISQLQGEQYSIGAAAALFFNGWSGPYHLVILLIGQNMAGRGRGRERKAIAIASDKDGRYCIPDDRCSQAY